MPHLPPHLPHFPSTVRIRRHRRPSSSASASQSQPPGSTSFTSDAQRSGHHGPPRTDSSDPRLDFELTLAERAVKDEKAQRRASHRSHRTGESVAGGAPRPGMSGRQQTGLSQGSQGKQQQQQARPRLEGRRPSAVAALAAGRPITRTSSTQSVGGGVSGGRQTPQSERERTPDLNTGAGAERYTGGSSLGGAGGSGSRPTLSRLGTTVSRMGTMGGIDEDPHLEREHTSTSNSPGASSSRQRQGTGDDRLDADWNAWTAAGNGPTSSSPSTLTSTPRPRAPERGQISRAGSWYDPLSQNAGGAGDEGERRTATSHPLDESLRAGTCTGNDGFERPQRLATSSTVLEDQHRHHEHPLSESDDEPDNGDGDEPHSGSTSSDEFYEDGVADYLDVVDPEISTLGVLSSVGHSIFVPNVPGLGFGSRTTTTDLARAPSVKRESTAKRTISRRGSVASSAGHGAAGQGDEGQTNRPTLGARLSSVLSLPTRAAKGGLSSTLPTSLPTTTTTTASVLTSKPEKPSSASASASASLGQGLTEGELGVGVGEGAESSDSHVAKWASMDELERNELDEHVRLLLTKKEKFKRGMRGFGKFVRTPMGFIMTLYGFLITFWGTAIVLFLLGWIDAGTSSRQRYWVEICDQILCALFAAVGLGFAPFRAVDTYRMIHIAHYHHYSWKRRRELGLPALEDPSDLPRPLRDRSDRRSSSSEVDTGTSPSPAGTGTGTGTGTDMAMDVGMETGLTETGQRKSSNSGISSPSQFQPSSPRPGQSPSTSSLAHLQPSAIAGAGAPSSSDSQSQSQSQSKSRSHSHHFSRSRSTNRDLEAALESAQDSYAYADAVSLAGSTLKKSEGEVVVLSAEQQAKLVHHEKKFHASHTFYRPHETVTHRAFPLSIMIAIVCLLDCHSMFQACLGGVTWGISYHHRPTWTTATLITLSLSCNATAGLLIWYGGNKTKKKEEVERRLRKALEEEALVRIEMRKVIRRAEMEME